MTDRNGHAIKGATMPLLLLFLLLTACGKDERHSPSEGTHPTSPVQALHQSLLEEIEASSDPETGWPSLEDCDGALWSGLAKAAGARVSLELAEHAPGEIHRRPYKPCWTKKEGDLGSKSTVSQDMLTGYLWGLWRGGDLAALQRVAAYGEARRETLAGKLLGWRMGEPYPEMASRVLMRENLIGLVGRMLYALSGGLDDRSYRHWQTSYLPVSADYAQHIQVLGILLQGETRPPVAPLVDVDGQELTRLRESAESYPKDALFQASVAIYSGDWTETESLLLDPEYQCPSYCRGPISACQIHRAFVASLFLKHNGGA